jgi:hypothetical protein
MPYLPHKHDFFDNIRTFEWPGTTDIKHMNKALNINKHMVQKLWIYITIYDLFDWWASLETSKFGGFRIQFAFDHLKIVTLAHFGLYVEKQEAKLLLNSIKISFNLKKKKGMLHNHLSILF